MQNNLVILGSFIILIVSILLLSFSSFELGLNQNDTNSISYQITQFGTKSLSIVFIISLITLLYYTYNFRECPST